MFAVFQKGVNRGCKRKPRVTSESRLARLSGSSGTVLRLHVGQSRHTGEHFTHRVKETSGPNSARPLVGSVPLARPLPHSPFPLADY